jgi:hypothetical protein
MEAMEAEARLSRELTTWLDHRYAALVVTQAADDARRRLNATS